MKHIARICKISLVLLLVFFFSEKSQAQKLKYKNIYELLDSEQYGAALPDLTTFLHENPKHGSAMIYMGVVAQVYEKDCAKAKTFFGKALEIIDQKELDKNKNYYGLWNRRNLRTGKYGVLLDDVRVDLDHRLEHCED